MPAIRGITVAVGQWYADLLSVTLPRNMRHLTGCLVITTPGDEAVKAVAASVPGVSVYETTDFYAHGAHFNKGLCIERGFDVLGREGWIAVWDSDCLWPDSLPLERLRPDCLHGARRRILEDPSRWHPGFDWRLAPRLNDKGAVGFFQLFNSEAAAIRDTRPWYDVSFSHAGGCDAAFIGHWPPGKRTILPVDVLHLGPTDTHWFGLSDEAKDIMARFVTENGWHRAAAKFTPEQVARAGEFVERVEVPGYDKSTFELPFVRRARQSAARQ